MVEIWPKRHPVLSGIIITAFGSVFFKEPREFLESVFLRLWMMLVSFYRWIVSGVSIPCWLLILLSVLSIAFIVMMIFKFTGKEECSPFLKYKKDFIKGVNWRWSWDGNRVVGLTPYCPNCDMCLTYIEHSKYDLDSGTSFYCDQCERVVANIKGGGMDYSMSVIIREIDRRVRNGLFEVDEK